MSTIASPPAQDSLIQTDPSVRERRNPFYIGANWLRWLQDSLIKRIQAAPEVLLANYQLLNQNTSILAAALPLGILGAGTYEVWAYVRPTTADGVGSTIAVALGWTENALALSKVVAQVTSDSVLDAAVGAVRVTIDANSALTYATAYTSVTPGKMKYKLQFTVKAISQ